MSYASNQTLLPFFNNTLKLGPNSWLEEVKLGSNQYWMEKGCISHLAGTFLHFNPVVAQNDAPGIWVMFVDIGVQFSDESLLNITRLILIHDNIYTSGDCHYPRS